MSKKSCKRRKHVFFSEPRGEDSKGACVHTALSRDGLSCLAVTGADQRLLAGRALSLAEETTCLRRRATMNPPITTRVFPSYIHIHTYTQHLRHSFVNLFFLSLSSTLLIFFSGGPLVTIIYRTIN